MKNILVSALAMAMFATGVNAAQNGQITFLGAVTQDTCDLSPEVNGAGANQIDLGTVKIGASGTPIDFKLVKNSVPSNTCAGITSGKIATVSFMGNLTSQGVENQGGTATGAYAVLIAKNAQTPNSEIKAGQDAVTFDATKLNSDGFQFSAELKPGQTAGDFRSVVSYAVAYN
ncbi:TPA: fimbrial protein [Escherichia coli]|nr:fimbrial protein [Escherichia coli]HEI2488326.1 fimbrial protein [Escherichia coli]HEI2493866.1 fimbrial protein [Escherichia coli]HEI2555877.1 fimbrial protein [Escherichia coli]HEI2570393.1 fimbrial protein [Escherichia coli]